MTRARAARVHGLFGGAAERLGIDADGKDAGAIGALTAAPRISDAQAPQRCGQRNEMVVMHPEEIIRPQQGLSASAMRALTWR
jgi:hypothetical protein